MGDDQKRNGGVVCFEGHLGESYMVTQPASFNSSGRMRGCEVKSDE